MTVKQVAANILCCFLATTVPATFLLASDDDSGKTSPVVPALRIVNATQTETPPEIDGQVLDEATWQQAEATTSFWQTTPNEGEAASQKTEVKILYSSTALYIGVFCYDQNPEEIVVADSRRDSPLDETDSFQIILDTFHDKQNGFLFATNPAGIEYDAQITNEGEGRFGGSSGEFNLNWDASWRVETQILENGWTAEFEIPFRTIRFNSGESQTWGVNFQRNIRRRNERSFWAPLPRQFNIQKISLAGELRGLRDIRQNNLKVVPYSLGDVTRDFGSGSDSEIDGDIGADLKYSVTPSLTLDATYNTDFAQVEVDDQQINLDRFSLFFPEKRPFFLENAGFFQVGTPQSVELFFSRRIGISEDGVEVPIVGGGRLSGKTAGLNLGFLNMQTEAVDFIDSAEDDTVQIQKNNFAVARVAKEFPNRSAVGALFVNRQGFGKFSTDNDYNRTLAVDGRWGIGRFGQLSGYAAHTFSPDLDGDENAFRLRGEYNSESWLLNLSYSQVGEDFNPEVGFLNRDGFRRLQGVVFYNYRPKDFLGFLELRPHVSYNSFWNFDGFQETGRWHIDNHWEWKSGYEIHTGINITRQGVTEEFDIFPDIFVQPGTYDHVEAQLSFFTNQGAWWSFRTSATIGGFFGGDRVSLSPSIRFRIGDAFNAQLNWDRNDINLPVGDFVTNLARLRLSYSFTPRVFVQGLMQYNDRDDIWSTNFRLGWLSAANTGLFMVYRETQEELDGVFETQFRSFTVKYSKLFDLLN